MLTKREREEFEAWMRQNCFLKENTIRLYSYIVGRMENDGQGDDRALVEAINRTLVSLNREKNMKSYSHAAFVLYLKWKEKKDLIPQIVRVPPQQPKRADMEKPILRDYFLVKENIPLIRSKKYRWAADVQLATGIRASEVLRIQLKDIEEQPASYLINITKAKGKYGRSKRFQVAVVESEVRKSLGEAIRQAREENWPYPFMYPHRWGRKLTEDELVRNNYARYWAEIKEAFQGRISTHDLRRTYAIRVYGLYKDINLVKAALHHERITDTERYIKEMLRINPLRLAEDVQQEEKPKKEREEKEPEEM